MKFGIRNLGIRFKVCLCFGSVMFMLGQGSPTDRISGRVRHVQVTWISEGLAPIGAHVHIFVINIFKKYCTAFKFTLVCQHNI